MLAVPQDVLPAQLEALLALMALRAPAGAVPDSQGGHGPPAAPPKPTHCLRTLHLDLSGHALALGQLKDLLGDAPHRLGQYWMLQGLVLRDCQLPPGATARAGLAGGPLGTCTSPALPGYVAGVAVPPSCCLAPLIAMFAAVRMQKRWRRRC